MFLPSSSGDTDAVTITSDPDADTRAAAEAVRELYDSSTGELFALIYGEQIHLGGFNASMALADSAGIRGGRGVDLCCNSGAGMRFLSRYRDVESMIGVDISSVAVEKGRARAEEDGITNVEFVIADACESGIPSDSADFVWGEDAWCYVPDKALLIKEAVRIVRPGGTIAFVDWVEGDHLTDSERELLSEVMRFPSLQTRGGYARMLEEDGCQVLIAEDTGLFSRQMELMADMLDTQHRWDALRVTSFDAEQVDATVQGLRMLAQWGTAGKIEQARIVARAS